MPDSVLVFSFFLNYAQLRNIFNFKHMDQVFDKFLK